MRKFYIFIILSIILSCTDISSFKHSSGNNSYLYIDSDICATEANLYAPSYICRNPLMCQPDEFQIVTQSLLKNKNYFRRCMQKKGYLKNNF